MAKASIPDPRHIANGLPIPGEHYCDQPYVVHTNDGAWLCVMTTGSGVEGAAGQHVIATRSTDHGHTWTDPVSIEPADGPEASYAVLQPTPSGRVYCFYNHNTDRVKEVKREDAGVYTRVDSLGHYVFKYSDDGGKTWSDHRYEIPIRSFEWDRKNIYRGKLRFFWNVGRPLVRDGAVLVPLHKVSAMGVGFYSQSEGSFLKSDNLLTERNPERLHWQTLPDGDVGLRTPAGGGRIAEEQSLSLLSDGSLYCVYRTVDGWPACYYSRDGGHIWSAPRYATYTPGGRRIKHSRAANFAWRCGNGKLLYWFHNHGGLATHRPGWDPYADRNPVWLCAGREIDTPEGKQIEWSQPEIALYDDDTLVRMSYPDLIEENGQFWVTETQKNVGRVHALDPKLVAGLFGQWENRSAVTDGVLLDLGQDKALGATATIPHLPVLRERDNTRADLGSRDTRAGITLDLWLRTEKPKRPTTLLDTMGKDGRGIRLTSDAAGTLTVLLGDGQTQSTWSSDTGVVGAAGKHHVAVVIDGGPKIITFVVDGRLNDGGDDREFGWGRFSPLLKDLNGSPEAQVGHSEGLNVERLRIYRRALQTSEVLGNFRSG